MFVGRSVIRLLCVAALSVGNEAFRLNQRRAAADPSVSPLTLDPASSAGNQTQSLPRQLLLNQRLAAAEPSVSTTTLDPASSATTTTTTPKKFLPRILDSIRRNFLPQVVPNTTWYKDIVQVNHAKARGNGYKKGSPLYAKQKCVADGNCDEVQTPPTTTTVPPAATDGKEGKQPKRARHKRDWTEKIWSRSTGDIIGPLPWAEDRNYGGSVSRKNTRGEYNITSVSDLHRVATRNSLAKGWYCIFGWIFGFIYYFMFVLKYPKLPDDGFVSLPHAATELQRMNELNADAQTLDLITGAETGLCSVNEPQQVMGQPYGRRAI